MLSRSKPNGGDSPGRTQPLVDHRRSNGHSPQGIELFDEPEDFFDCLDTLEDGFDTLGTPRQSTSGTSPRASTSAPAEFLELTPQEQVASVVKEGGVPFELCGYAWNQGRHTDRIQRLLAATKDRVAREKGVDRAAAKARARATLKNDTSSDTEDVAAQAKSLMGTLKMGQDISKFELPATFLTPFSAIQATEDVLTIICGTERDLETWRSMSDVGVPTVQRFLRIMQLYIDMESVRSEEGTSGGTKSSFPLPSMKKPINSVIGETHRVRVGDIEMLAEQVSHHPPITCWELEHEGAGVRMTGNLAPKPVFHGTSVQIALRATLMIELEATGEVYSASVPDLHIRFFGLGGSYNETVGKIRFERVCPGRTGDDRKLWADLHFKPRGSAGWKSKANRMEGCVYEAPASSHGGCGAGGGMGYGYLQNFGHVDEDVASKAARWCVRPPVGATTLGDAKIVMTLKGHWNDTLYADGDPSKPFWHAARRKRQMPIAQTVPLDLETESHLVWGDLIRAIVNKEWKKANVAKKRLEVAQRRLMKEIKEGRKKWEPRLFRLGEHPDRGPLAGLYTTKSNVRTDPPGTDPLWHELIAKEVFTDL